jgi:hypothetical protein
LAASTRGFYPSALNANSNTTLTNNWGTQRNVTIVGVQYTAGLDGNGGMFISFVQMSAVPRPRIPVAGSNRKDRALVRFAVRASRQNDMTPGFAQTLADNWRIARGMKPRRSGYALEPWLLVVLSELDTISRDDFAQRKRGGTVRDLAASF